MVLLSAATVSLAFLLPHFSLSHRTCGTHDASPEHIKESNNVVHRWLETNKDRNLQQAAPYEIPVCFHVIRPALDSSPNFLDAAGLQVQLNALNKAYSSTSCCDATQPWCNNECSVETGFRFAIGLLNGQGVYDPALGTTDSVSDPNACVTRSNDNDWYFAVAHTDVEEGMKRQLRQGDESVLNVYAKSAVNQIGERLLGYATLPSWYALEPHLDGVVIDDGTIVGGEITESSEGDTFAHETGHWLGLYHTFQDGCDLGDRIFDTPSEKSAAFGCQVGRDTCPGTGTDPVHNFMDYSDDTCLFEFSPGQVVRMTSQYEIYRVSGQRKPIPIEIGESSAVVGLFEGLAQTFLVEAPANTQVTCRSTSLIGDALLAMRLNSEPVFSENNDCVSDRQVCSVNNNQGEPTPLFVTLLAYKMMDVSVTCSATDLLPLIDLQSGVASVPVSLATGSFQAFRLSTPVDEGGIVRCETFGGIDGQDADLSVRWNSAPDTSAGLYDCSSAESSSTESCTVESPMAASVLYAVIVGFTAISEVVITCTSVASTPPIVLSDGFKSAPVQLQTFGVQHFTLAIEPQSIVTCTAIASGEGTMSLRFGQQPDLSDDSVNGCTSTELTAAARPCEVVDPGLYAQLWVSVQAATPISDLEVLCVSFFQEPVLLAEGLASDPVSLGNTRVAFFQFNVRRGARIACTTAVNEALSAGSEVDLYVRFDLRPDLLNGIFDCESASVLAAESCVVVDTGDASILWVSVKAFGSVEGLTVLCSSEVTEVVDSEVALDLVDGVPSEPFSLAAGQGQNFVVSDIVAGTLYVCSTNGATGGSDDADLYVRWNTAPDVVSGTYDCSSASNDPIEECSVTAPSDALDLWAAVEAYSAFQDVVITCESVVFDPVAELLNGVPAGPFSLLSLEIKSFSIPIERGDEVSCETATVNGAGDVDLFVRWDTKPSLDTLAYDCRSTSLWSIETCTVRDPGSASTLWVAVQAIGDVADISITCTRSSPSPAISLMSGVPSDTVDLVAGGKQAYTISIAPGERVVCTTTATAGGDVDILVQLGQAPEFSELRYDCISRGIDSDETCLVENSGNESSVLWVVADAYLNTIGVTVTCTNTAAPTAEPPIDLEDGVPSAPFSMAAGNEQSFAFAVQTGTTVTCETIGTTGNADLYLRWDLVPQVTAGLYDCISAGSTSNESCQLEDEGFATVLYATVTPYSSFTDLTITCKTESPTVVTVLQDGVASDPFSLTAGLSRTFSFTIDAPAKIETIGSAGDADLYISQVNPHSDSVYKYDCVSVGSTSMESCTLWNVDSAATFYATVQTSSFFTDVVLIYSSLISKVVAVELADGVPTEAFSLRTKEVREYYMALPVGSNAASCTISSIAHGDSDLYLRWDDAPVIDEALALFDCASQGFDSNESCFIQNPPSISSDTTVWVRVEAYASSENIVLMCRSTVVAGTDPPPTTPSPVVASNTAAPASTNPTKAPLLLSAPTSTAPDAAAPAPSNSTKIVDGTTAAPATARPALAPGVAPFPASAARESMGTCGLALSVILLLVYI